MDSLEWMIWCTNIGIHINIIIYCLHAQYSKRHSLGWLRASTESVQRWNLMHLLYVLCVCERLFVYKTFFYTVYSTVQYITSLSNIYHKCGDAHVQHEPSKMLRFALILMLFFWWVRACVTYWIAVSVYTKQPNNVNAQQHSTCTEWLHQSE